MLTMFRICRRIMDAFPPAATAHRGKSGRSIFFGTGPRQENMPLDSDRDVGVDREVHPRVPDAWMDSSKDKISCEININRYFMYRDHPTLSLGLMPLGDSRRDRPEPIAESATNGFGTHMEAG